jgi:putative zinc finger/helix-turn-helix YgiT family protein
MNGYCPNCDKETTLVLIRDTEDVNIRGEMIPIEVEYYKCKECGEEFEKPRHDQDSLELAYREYRRRKGMLQPEVIQEFRQKYRLTQKEVSELFGIGVATLSRYENGALQEEAHDRILQYGMDPRSLLKLIEQNPQILHSDKRNKLIQELQPQNKPKFWLGLILDNYGNYEPSIYSGYQKFQAIKLFQAIKFLCSPEGIFKTKLTKLLFYVDFSHFKEYAVSITGSRYVHLPYGPVPDQYEIWINTLIGEDSSISLEEVWSNDFPGEKIISRTQADLSAFSSSEILTLAIVKKRFEDYSARRIMEFSHQEKGYQETRDRQFISYDYAEQLQI